MENFKYMLFDLDGTLVDSGPDLLEALNYILKKNNLEPIDDYHIGNLVGGGAEIMIKRITDETSIKNTIIKKISKTKYRVLLGPFDDIKKIENTFNEIKSLNFENIEILKDV